MKGTLLAPEKLPTIPSQAKWLGGEGAGVWFVLEQEGNDTHDYRLKRFAPDGTLHCNRIFRIIEGDLDINLPFYFTYPSHCLFCTIIQKKQKIVLKYAEAL